MLRHTQAQPALELAAHRPDELAFLQRAAQLSADFVKSLVDRLGTNDLPIDGDAVSALSIKIAR